MAATAPEPAFWDALGWQPSQAQRDQLVELQGLLQSWNERVNLTRLVNGDDFWIGHFDGCGSITLARAINYDNASLIAYLRGGKSNAVRLVHCFQHVIH